MTWMELALLDMALSPQSLSHARMKVPLPFGLLLLTLFARLTVAVSGTSGPFISGSESGRPSAEDLFVDVQAMADACPGEKEKMVMSLACYANPSSIAPFVRSWRMFSNETRILLMTNDERIHTALHRPPEVHVIMIRPIKDPKFLRAGKNLKKLPWWSWRMFGYVAFLEACAAKGSLPHGIITADARDSMAMGDPWKHPLAERAIEENMTIFSYENQVYENGEPGVLLNKNEPWDKRMLINCFKSMQPYKVMDHLLNSPLTCAGAQIGSGQAMLAYHEVLLELALRNSSRMCMLIADQGLHNFMLHVMGRLWNTLPFKWEAYANGLSWLYTASVAMPIQINEDTGVISVHRKGWDHYPLYVHKFDRNATLYETVKHLYKLEGLDSQ